MFPFGASLIRFLLLLPYRLYRSLTGRGRATFDLGQWAEERDLEVVELEPSGLPPYSVERQFPDRRITGRGLVMRRQAGARPWDDTKTRA
jgi:hypothetical protein